MLQSWISKPSAIWPSPLTYKTAFLLTTSTLLEKYKLKRAKDRDHKYNYSRKKIYTEDLHELDLLLKRNLKKFTANLLPTSNLGVKFEPN